MKIFVIHGPNLHLLGLREPHLYGNVTLKDLNNSLITLGLKLSANISCFQSNHEGQLIDKISEFAVSTPDCLIINPASYSASIALRDCILAVGIPCIEVHMSNIYSREEFRHKSYLNDIAIASIVGCGVMGYELAIQYAVHYVKQRKVRDGL